MNLLDTKKMKLFFAFSSLIFASFQLLEGASVATPIGSPIRISPIPGPTNPDPILSNLQAVMDNHYQLPGYEGFFIPPAGYLSGIFLQTNVYTVGTKLSFNPIDDNIMVTQIGQNFIYDLTNTFVRTIGTNTFTSTHDAGLSWKHSRPIEQIIPLGGTISQIINASLGPGLFMEYGTSGKLYASGHGFMDMVANPPDQSPSTGFLFTTSENNGKNWAALEIVLSSHVNWWIYGGIYSSVGEIGPREFYTRLYPPNNDLIHASTMFPLTPAFPIYGNLFYFRSTNGGKTFSTPKQIYSMIDDPVWLEKYFDPDFTADPNYFLYGGLSISSAHPVIYDEDVLLLPIHRQYPKKGSTLYDGLPETSNYDQAVVRSFDNGKTWHNVAGATDQYLPSNNVVDPGFIDPFDNNFQGVFSEGIGQGSSPIVSPFTGRIYLTYAAAIPNDIPNLNFAWNYPRVILSASSNKGKSWSHAVQINQTPTNIPLGAQQAFDSAATMTHDGYYVVVYYDFRNWTGTPGEDVLTTPLNTDVWLAVYRETDDPKGGSTGVGLDFVEEIRVTPQSFDARIMGQLGIPTTMHYPYLTGTPEGMALTVNNNNQLYVVFAMNNERSLSNLTILEGYKGMSIDTNNRTNIFVQRYQFPKPGNQ